MNRTNDLHLRFPNASASFLKLHGLGDVEPAKVPDAYALSKDPSEVPKPRTARPRSIPGPSESQSQQALFKWWVIAHNQWGLPEHILMAFPLQGMRTARNGSRMKAEGMRRGTPDILLAAARGGYHCLWIELKSDQGRLSVAQKIMLQSLADQGHATVVCRSTALAILAIEGYLGHSPFSTP